MINSHTQTWPQTSPYPVTEEKVLWGSNVLSLEQTTLSSEMSSSVRSSSQWWVRKYMSKNNLLTSRCFKEHFVVHTILIIIRFQIC